MILLMNNRLPVGLQSRTLGSLEPSSRGNILLGVLLPKSLFLRNLTANCDPRFFSCVTSEHLLRSLELPIGEMFSECLRNICSGVLGLSTPCTAITSFDAAAPIAFDSAPVGDDVSPCSLPPVNLTLHSELLRDVRDESLPRRLASELRRLGLDTVIIGKLAIDGVGVGGLTYTSGTVEFGSELLQ